MNWEFIGKAEVTNNSNNRFKRVMLTIGIVCLLFAMIVELMISLRNQISKKKIVIDVPINISIKQNNVEIIFKNTIRNKKGYFSEKFNFKIEEVEKCNYLKKYHQLQILTNSQYCKVNDSSVEIGKTRTRNIKFHLPNEIQDKLLYELEKQLKIDYFG